MQLTEGQMMRLAQEIEKLCLYVGTRQEVRPEDLEQLCPPPPEHNVFAVVDAVAAARSGRAVSLLRQMLNEGLAPQQMLSLLGRQFRLIILAAELRQRGLSPDGMAAYAHEAPFVLRRALEQSRLFPPEQAEQALELLLAADLAAKSGRQGAAEALELAILEIAALRRA